MRPIHGSGRIERRRDSGERGDGHGGQQREHQEAAVVQPASGARVVGHGGDAERERHHAGHGEQPFERGAGDGPAVQHQGQGGTDQQRLRPGVGAVIGARRVGEAPHQVRHPEGRSEHEHDDHGQHRLDAAAEHREEAEQHGWPEEVPLLLDGERPHVPQRRGWPELGEVGVVAPDLRPVGHVGQRREGVDAQRRGPFGRRGHVAVDGHADKEQEQRGEEPPGPAQVEGAEGEVAGADDLAQQQGGDEVAAEHEEDVDPEQPTGRPGDAPVVEHDGQHGHRAQAVEARQVPEAREVTTGRRRARDALGVGAQTGGHGRSRKDVGTERSGPAQLPGKACNRTAGPDGRESGGRASPLVGVGPQPVT